MLAAIDERLRAPVHVGGQRMSWGDLFVFEARRLASFVAGRRSAYRPHVHDWH